MPEETKHLPSQDVADSERSGDRRLLRCSRSLVPITRDELTMIISSHLIGVESHTVAASALERKGAPNGHRLTAADAHMNRASELDDLRAVLFPENAEHTGGDRERPPESSQNDI